ncbi:beta-ketoacyl-ACP reductase [Anaerotardibacter muris]|uniref:beta-ketoacyl-ACP reductase n=1 Tax=Anaerotardibacter muris TaxID=2941505 RepID=UPI0020417EEC|nr:beta-ketoacyl-ACP reductase [Anaerotardibacter muris]
MTGSTQATEEQAPIRRVALVTGASRGIGAAIARRFALDGYSVVLNYASDSSADAVASLCAELDILAREQDARALDIDEPEEPQRFVGMQADVSLFDAAKNLIADVKEQFGRIDVLVNNAGITRDGLLMRMKEDAFDRVIEVNLKGAFNCLRHTAPIMMKQRYGRIVSVSSVVGVAGNAGQVNYAASKAGIIGMTKAAAKELAARGVTANAVAPGFIDTAMTDALSDAMKEQILGRIASGEFGQPDDVANAVAFFADPATGYVTGQVLCIDGGMSL